MSVTRIELKAVVRGGDVGDISTKKSKRRKSEHMLYRVAHIVLRVCSMLIMYGRHGVTTH